MKIIGEITVFKNSEVLNSQNFTVDGAGKTLCDLLTTSPTLSSVNPRLLDTSNYTIQALSFGKDALAWSTQGHHASAINYLITKKVPSFVSGVGVGLPQLYNSLPSYPNPEDLFLETNVVPSLQLSSGFSIDQSWMYGGQLTNLAGLWREIYNASSCPFYPSSVSSFTLADVSTLAMRYGSFVSGSTTNNISGLIILSSTGLENLHFILSSTSSYNSTGIRTMDYRGFVNFIGTSTPASFNNYDKSGLVLVYNTNFSSLLEVEYRHTMNKIDVLTASFYNGFNSLGLWCIDVKKTLQAQQPSFTFDPVTNKRQYRLFSKKTFNKNLLDVPNSAGNIVPAGPDLLASNIFQDFTISWKIKFK